MQRRVSTIGLLNRFRKKLKTEECQLFFLNETTREVELVRAKAREGQIHYEDKCWLVQTDPLFLEKKALYIVGDKHIPTFEVELEEPEPKSETETEESTEPKEEQKSVRPESLSPTALKTAVTSSFFKALMSPVHWDRAEWVKAIGVGFAFYMIVKWVLISIFKVPLP